MNYYDEIKRKLIDNEIYGKVKDYSKERNTVITYFEIGRLLNEDGNKYGDKIINEYSRKLIKEVNKKYNARTLRRMRQFYKKFNDKKWSTMSTKLSWSHYTELLPIKDEDELTYYLNICINRNIDVRSLREKIHKKEYNRLPLETKNKLIANDNIGLNDLIPDPIFIKNRSGMEIVTEKMLKQLILDDIEYFMRELGNSFCFVSSEYKIKLGDRYNYIDLLLYNIKYKCYTVIELKVVELKKEHIGQITMYMHYIDKNIKTIDENETVGIIICRCDNKYVIEYCSDERIISRTYEVI